MTPPPAMIATPPPAPPFVRPELVRPAFRAHPCREPPRYSGNPSGTTHSSRLPVDIDAWRNKVRLITARRGYADLLRKPACSPVGWVPHRGQNDRSDFAVELNRLAWPLVMRNSIDLTLNMFRNGGPVVRPTFPAATAFRATGVASFHLALCDVPVRAGWKRSPRLARRAGPWRRG